MLYSSLDAKQTIVEDFHQKYPDCSKKSIERLLKEITVREKRDGDEKAVYYCTAECWQELTEVQQAELQTLASDRMQPLREEA